MARKAKKKTSRSASRSKKTSRSRAKKSAEMLMVASKVKQALRENNVNVASDAVESLNNVVHWYIQQAAARALANGRKTVRGHDFLVGN
ncbi:MAG: hypothetical protein D6718_07900 [Acidobacteria bacterium]|nr:MAG: hypothetical protein D6718_07900 [Acidobacteriota bacterium]